MNKSTDIQKKYKIPLGKTTKFVLVDPEDFEYLSQWKWYGLKTNNHIYARRTDYSNGKKDILMHRVIMGATKGYEIDHINHDTLDNRKQNLRLVTKQQNAFNRKSRGGTSKFKGVCWSPISKSWRVNTTINGKTKYIGSFTNEEEAATAYNNAIDKYQGEYSYKNQVRSCKCGLHGLDCRSQYQICCNECPYYTSPQTKEECKCANNYEECLQCANDYHDEHCQPSPETEEECKHIWVGVKWQPDTQSCSNCGISWRTAFPPLKTPSPSVATEEGWAERYKKRFRGRYPLTRGLKTFIAQEMSKERERILEIVKEWYHEAIIIQELNEGKTKEEASAYAQGSWKVAGLRFLASLPPENRKGSE